MIYAPTHNIFFFITLIIGWWYKDCMCAVVREKGCCWNSLLLFFWKLYFFIDVLGSNFWIFLWSMLKISADFLCSITGKSSAPHFIKTNNMYTRVLPIFNLVDNGWILKTTFFEESTQHYNKISFRDQLVRNSCEYFFSNVFW